MGPRRDGPAGAGGATSSSDSSGLLMTSSDRLSAGQMVWDQSSTALSSLGRESSAMAAPAGPRPSAALSTSDQPYCLPQAALAAVESLARPEYRSSVHPGSAEGPAPRDRSYPSGTLAVRLVCRTPSAPRRTHLSCSSASPRVPCVVC